MFLTMPRTVSLPFFLPVLKLIVGIKVILDRRFAASCGQYNFIHAGSDGFFDHVFDNGTVAHG